MQIPAGIKGIILDKDGVFVDFRKLWERVIVYRAQLIAENSLEAWDHFEKVRANAMKVMGLDPGTEEFDPYSPGACMPKETVKISLASSLYTYLHDLNANYTWKEAFDSVETSFAKVESEFDFIAVSEPIDAVVEKINEFYNKGYKLAVLTSDIEANAIGALDKFAIRDKFLFVQAGKHKTPELFKDVCRRMGLKPEETIMVGDTPGELRAAKSCGAFAVGVLSGVVNQANKQILDAEADLVINSLAELTVADSIQKANNGINNNMKEVVLFSDGASRGNPGEASVGVVLEEAGKEVATISKTLGVATNNYAEYQAMVEGLQKALELGYTKVVANADSELMIKQLNGEYKVKSENVRPLFAKVKELEAQFELIQYNHIKRDLNKRADKLANMALDAY